MNLPVEFDLCMLAALVAWPVAKDIALRYFIFAGMAIVVGHDLTWDATAVSMIFAAYAMIDCMVGMLRNRLVFFVSSFCWVILSVESMMLIDYMLNNLVYIDAIINAWLALIIAREWKEWRHTKRLSSLS
jgi:hypothetical protein